MNKRILTVDLVSTTGLEVENIDLVESDSEDDDYHLRRKRGIPSRTAEIASRLSTFYSDVDRNTNICLHASTPMGKKRRRILTFHLSMICRGERQEDKVKCFISYAKPREMFCNVLLGAGLMELEPSAGHVICHPDTGIRLCRMADMCKDKHFIEPSEEQVQSLVRSLTERMFEADCPIRSIFLPIDLNECHWGLLVLDIVEKGDGYEERVLSFGDSLRFTCPLHIKKFFQAVVDGCFPPKKGTRWKFERKNYMLDYLRYERQRDVYSCGAYVISAVSEGARTKGCMPRDTFRRGYDPKLTEKYRWGCVEARVRSIFSATIGNGILQSTEFLVDEHMLRKRKYFYECRHKKRNDKKNVSPTTVSTRKKKSFTRLKSIRKPLKVAGKPSKERKVRFEDSILAVTSIVNDVFDLAVNCSKCTRASTGGKLVGAELRKKRKQSIESEGRSEEEEVLHDFPRKLYELTKNGYSYGVHYCRPSVNNRQKHYLILRLRCLKYVAPWKCKAAIIGKLLADKRTWNMKYKLTHNHSCSELTSAAIKKRVTTVCSSSLFEVRHDDRTELRGVFTLRETERAENAEKGDEDLETKDGYEKLKHCAPKGNNATALDKDDLILSDSSVPNSLKAVVGSTFERRNTAEEAKVVVDNGHAGVGVDSREDATDIDTLSPLGTLWDSDHAEEVVDTDENGLQTREIVEGKEEDVECPKTSYGCEEGNGVVDEQEKITEYFQHSEMVAVLMSFIDGRQINAPGREVLLQLQYLSEGFGYDLTIRDSKYRDGMEEGRDEEEKSKRILKRALLVCQKSDSIHQCPFSLIVFTVQSHVVSEEGCAEEALMENWRYACDVSKACHNHEPDARILRKLLPPSAQEEAMKMHNILRMGYADVLKYLEYRYHIRIDRETLRQHLKYMKDKQNPKDQDSLRLCESLSKLQEENPRHRVFFATRGDDSMHYTAWAFEEWREDYERYGIIPGISIDCKAIANRFSFPLFSINGRTSSGQVRTFFMGFVPSETEESFTWMLQKFMSVVPVSPGMVFVDQNAALIAAVRKVMPNSFLALDDWHLNKNQIKNVSSWCQKIQRLPWNKEMSTDLHVMRRSNTIEEFHSRREQFEQKYFHAFNMPLPRWYDFLYRHNPSMLIRVYKTLYMPMQFLFQGTGSSESANSMFRHYILRPGVPIFDVPKVMLELTKRRRAMSAHISHRKRPILRQLSSSSLGIPAKQLWEMCQNYTAYCLDHFIRISVMRSAHYRVDRSYITDGHAITSTRRSMLGLDDTPDTQVAAFVVSSCTTLQSNTPRPPLEFLVYVCRTRTGQHTRSVSKGFCTCLRQVSRGFPCAHMVRVSTVYAEEVSRTPAFLDIVGPRFPLEELLHPYWKADPASWTLQNIGSLRAVVGNRGESMDNRGGRESNETNPGKSRYGGHELQADAKEGNNSELSFFFSYADCTGLCTQMHRLAWTQGPLALDGLKNFLQSGLQSLNSGQAFHVQTPAYLPIPRIVELLGSQPTVEAALVRNPNSGHGRSRKRRRGFNENMRGHRKRSNSRRKRSNSVPATTRSDIDGAINSAIRNVDPIMRNQ